MSAPETSQARHAALLVHGLTGEIRQQVIARLSAAEATRMQSLLDELSRLGVSESLAATVRHLASSLPAPATSRQPDVRELLGQLNAERVERCLRHRATPLVAQLLRAEDWPWKTQVLARMPQARRTAVLARMDAGLPALSPSVLTLLCERLYRRASDRRIDTAGEVSGVDRTDRTVCTVLALRFKRLLKWIR